MIALVEEKREELRKLCEKYGVKRLEVFGSAADGTFNHETSDLDFLYEFIPDPPGGHWDAYWGLHESLVELFGRKVDLVSPAAQRNPYFIRAFNASRIELYAA